MGAQAVENDPVVGWITREGGEHEPLRDSVAKTILAAVDEQKAKRASDMPTEQDAVNELQRAYLRLKELGWKDAQYCPKNGESFKAIEIGSTGIHDCSCQGEWPNVSYWIYDGGDMWPSNPMLFRLEKKEEKK